MVNTKKLCNADSDGFTSRKGLHEAVSSSVRLAGLQRGVRVKDVGAGGVCICPERCQVTDAVLQHGIKTPGTAPFPGILQMKERRYKMFLKFFMHTSAVWRESDRAFSHTRVCVLLLCCVASGICKVSLTSPAAASSCPPCYPLSAHKRLCLDQTEHYAQQGHSHCIELCCLLNIFVFLSVLTEAFIKEIVPSKMKMCWRCFWVCFFIRTDLEKCSITSLALQWPLCS